MAEIHSEDRSEDRSADHAERLLEAVNESARLARRVFNTFLVAAALAALAVWMTDDVQILLGGAISAFGTTIALPIGGVTIAIQGLILLLHFNLLMHLGFLAEKLHALESAIKALPGSAAFERYRVRVFPFFFCHRLIGTPHIRRLAAIITWVFLALCPLLLLVAVEISLLPYHDAAITWWHRAAVMADMVFLAAFWPRIVAPGSNPAEWWAGPYRPCADAARHLTGLASGVVATVRGFARRQIPLGDALTAPWQHLYASRLPVPYREPPAPSLTPAHVAEPSAMALTGCAALVLVLLVAVIPGEAIERWAIRAAPSFLIAGEAGREQGCRPDVLAATCRLFDRRNAVFHRNLQLANTVLVSADTVPQTVFDLRKQRSERGDARRAAVGLILANRDLRYADLGGAIMPKAICAAPIWISPISGAPICGTAIWAATSSPSARHAPAGARWPQNHLAPGAHDPRPTRRYRPQRRPHDRRLARRRGVDPSPARRGGPDPGPAARRRSGRGPAARRPVARGAARKRLSARGPASGRQPRPRPPARRQPGRGRFDRRQPDRRPARRRAARQCPPHRRGAAGCPARRRSSVGRAAPGRRPQPCPVARCRSAPVPAAGRIAGTRPASGCRSARRIGCRYQVQLRPARSCRHPAPARAPAHRPPVQAPQCDGAKRDPVEGGAREGIGAAGACAQGTAEFRHRHDGDAGAVRQHALFQELRVQGFARFIPGHTAALRKLACTDSTIAVSMVRRVVSAGAPNLLQWHLARALGETPLCKAIAALPRIIHVKLKETGSAKKPAR